MDKRSRLYLGEDRAWIVGVGIGGAGLFMVARGIVVGEWVSVVAGVVELAVAYPLGRWQLKSIRRWNASLHVDSRDRTGAHWPAARAPRDR